MAKQEINGSADLLAKAIRAVFEETVAVATNPLLEEMGNMEGRIYKHVDGKVDELNDRIDTTNTNMQSQFAQVRKDIAGGDKR